MTPPRVSEVIKDLADAAEAYAIAVQAFEGGLMLGTEASGERGQEGRLITAGIPSPVAAAHSAIRLEHFYILDCYRTLARLTVLEPPSVNGPYVIARSLLDSAGRAHWLAQPGIGVERRVQRDLVRQLSEGNQQAVPDRPELREVRDRIRNERAAIRIFCERYGWTYQRGGRRGESPKVGDESIPSPKTLIGRLFDQDVEEIERGLGATLWWWLCGFTHGGLDALLHTLERNPSGDPTKPTAMIMVRGDAFTWLLVVCGRATIAVTDRRRHFFGEDDDVITARSKELQAQFTRYLEAVSAGRFPAPPQ